MKKCNRDCFNCVQEKFRKDIEVPITGEEKADVMTVECLIKK